MKGITRGALGLAIGAGIVWGINKLIGLSEQNGKPEFDADGYNAEGFDVFGFNRDGYDHEGYGRDGFNADGYDRNGYDKNGYDTAGNDRAGNSREHYAETVEELKAKFVEAGRYMEDSEYAKAASLIRSGLESGIKCVLEHYGVKEWRDRSFSEAVRLCDHFKYINDELLESVSDARDHCNSILHDIAANAAGYARFCSKAFAEVIDTVEKMTDTCQKEECRENSCSCGCQCEKPASDAENSDAEVPDEGTEE